MRDIPAPPLFTKVRGFSGAIDRWQIIDFAPPSTIVIDARAVPTGTNDLDQGMRWMVVNTITPQTESSSRYFYSVTRCFSTDDASLDKVIGDQIYATFEEDKEVIEVQQHLIPRARLCVPCHLAKITVKRPFATKSSRYIR